MRMLFDNVLITKFEKESQVVTVGEGKGRIMKGTVVEVGPGQAYGLPDFAQTILKKGDIIYFLKDVAYKVEINEQEYWIVRERDVLCVL